MLVPSNYAEVEDIGIRKIRTRKEGEETTILRASWAKFPFSEGNLGTPQGFPVKSLFESHPQ